MVDVLNLPDNAFGYVPTPALVAPLEFTVGARIITISAAMTPLSAASARRSRMAANTASSRVLGPGEKTLLTRDDKEI